MSKASPARLKRKRETMLCLLCGQTYVGDHPQPCTPLGAALDAILPGEKPDVEET